MLDVVVFPIVCDTCDVVDVGVGFVELCDDGGVVPLFVRWLYKCVIVVWVFVLLVVLV